MLKFRLLESDCSANTTAPKIFTKPMAAFYLFLYLL